STEIGDPRGDLPEPQTRQSALGERLGISGILLQAQVGFGFLSAQPFLGTGKSLLMRWLRLLAASRDGCQAERQRQKGKPQRPVMQIPRTWFLKKQTRF